MINNYVFKLMKSFPRSFINEHGEFIAHEKANEFFKLSTCIDEAEVKCKVLEWFSRGASKTECFDTKKQNKEFRMFMLNGINEFLETKFSAEEMSIIYQMLGNNVNRKLCEGFINSGFDIDLLKESLETE